MPADQHENLDPYDEVEGLSLIDDGQSYGRNIELEDDYFQPLYEGATVSICEAFVAIMHFKKTCKLPFTTIHQLLQDIVS